jgi:hypothetical protein
VNRHGYKLVLLYFLQNRAPSYVIVVFVICKLATFLKYATSISCSLLAKMSNFNYNMLGSGWDMDFSNFHSLLV